MPKSKQRRKLGSRFNPLVSNQEIVLNNEDGLELLVSQAPTSGGLKKIEEKIRGSSVEERIVSLNTLAGIALEDGAPETIAKTGLLYHVIPLLNDESIQVKLTAVGALRNICAGGSDDVVEELLQKKILDPLSKLILECDSHCKVPLTSPVLASKIEMSTPGMEDPEKLWIQILIHALNLMWNLCECSEFALKTFNEKDLLSVIVHHIEPTWGYPLAMASADCLLCVSEENEQLMASDHLLPLITNLIRGHDNSPTYLRYAITMCGCLANISNASDSQSLILQTICQVLEFDTYSISKLSTEKTTTDSLDIATLENAVSAQQLALEIFTNVCSFKDNLSDEGSDHFGSFENLSENVEEPMEEDLAEMEQQNEFALALPCDIEEGIKSYSLVEKTIHKINILDEIYMKTLSTEKIYTALISKLKILRIRALICLQNLASCLCIETLGGGKILHKTWIEIGKLLVSADQADFSLLEAATGALRAIIDRLCMEKCVEHLSDISEEELKVLFEMGKNCSMPNIRANLTRTVGALGCLLMNVNDGNDLSNDEKSCCVVLAAISNHLLKIGGQDEELWVCSEALDAIIDIYSDDKTDKLAHKISLTERLKGINTVFKTKYRQKAKNLGDQKALIITVRDNLVNFIKYKSLRILKLNKSLKKSAKK